MRYKEFLVGTFGFNCIEEYETLEEALEAFEESKTLNGFESGELIDTKQRKVLDAFIHDYKF